MSNGPTVGHETDLKKMTCVSEHWNESHVKSIGN